MFNSDKGKYLDISGAEVLITGGAGFIGSNLAEKLLEIGAKVTILDAMIAPYGSNKFNIKKIKQNSIFIKGDVRSPSVVNKCIAGKDFIFHLAGQTGRIISMNNPILDTSINCVGTLTVLNAIRNQKKKPKLIFAGSRGVIGKPKYLPVDEKHPQNPRDIYGINKLAAEQYSLLFGKNYEFAVTSLRLNNVYGPKCQIKSNHYGTINLFIAYALQNRVLPIYGDGEQARDYIYVTDVVDAFIKAMSPKADGEIFFVGTEKETPLIHIIDYIKKEIPTVRHKFVPFPIDLKSVDFKNFYSTSRKMKTILSWQPTVTIQQGIRKTIDFYQKNLTHYL